MKIILTLILTFLFATSAFAVNLDATGNDWVDYTDAEKLEFVEAAYSNLGVTEGKVFPPEVIAQNLDMMYKYKAGSGMNTPCLKLIRAMVGKGGQVGRQQ